MKFQKTEVKILSEINVKLKNGENEKTFSSLEEFENEIKKELEKENVQEISVVSNEDYDTGDDLETPYFNEKLFKIANYAPNFSYENRKLFLERKDGKIKITFGYTEIVDAQLETFFEKYINVYGDLFEKDGEFDLEKGYIYADYECDRLKTLFEIFVEMSNGKAGYGTRLIERESEAQYDTYYLEIEKLNSEGKKLASFVIGKLHKINVRIYIKLSCITLYKFLTYGAYYEYQVRRKDGSRKNLPSIFCMKDSLYIPFKRGFLNSVNIDFDYIQDKIFLKDCRNMNKSQSTFPYFCKVYILTAINIVFKIIL